MLITPAQHERVSHQQKTQRPRHQQRRDISFQSLSPAVLETWAKEHVPEQVFGIDGALRQRRHSHLSELILGLPGETYESFCDGVGLLLEAGQHASILIYNCELIANSRMADEQYMQKFEIRSAVTPLYLRHDEPECADIPEFSRSVTATAAMNEDDWIDANLFAVTVQSCHGMGLLRCAAVWLYHEKHLRYQEFYKALISWAQKHPDSVLGEQLRFLRGEFKKIAAGTGRWSYTTPCSAKYPGRMKKDCISTSSIDLKRFLRKSRRFFPLISRTRRPEDLLTYQKSLIKLPAFPLSVFVCVTISPDIFPPRL